MKICGDHIHLAEGSATAATVVPASAAALLPRPRVFADGALFTSGLLTEAEFRAAKATVLVASADATPTVGVRGGDGRGRRGSARRRAAGC